MLIQLQVLLDGYKPLTTQIFDKKSKYLDDDSVFAVKDSLVVDFKERKNDSQAPFELEYDVLLAPMESKGESDVHMVMNGTGVSQ